MTNSSFRNNALFALMVVVTVIILSGCSGSSPTAPPEPTVTQCNDGIDNDGDGLVDMADPGCSNALDDDESDEARTSFIRNMWADPAQFGLDPEGNIRRHKIGQDVNVKAEFACGVDDVGPTGECDPDAWLVDSNGKQFKSGAATRTTIIQSGETTYVQFWIRGEKKGVSCGVRFDFILKPDDGRSATVLSKTLKNGQIYCIEWY